MPPPRCARTARAPRFRSPSGPARRSRSRRRAARAARGRRARRDGSASRRPHQPAAEARVELRTRDRPRPGRGRRPGPRLGSAAVTSTYFLPLYVHRPAELRPELGSRPNLAVPSARPSCPPSIHQRSFLVAGGLAAGPAMVALRAALQILGCRQGRIPNGSAAAGRARPPPTPGRAAHPVVAGDPRGGRSLVPGQRVAGPAPAAEPLAAERAKGVRAAPVAGILLTDTEIDNGGPAAPARVLDADPGVRERRRPPALTDGMQCCHPRRLQRGQVDSEPGAPLAVDGSSLEVEWFAGRRRRATSPPGPMWRPPAGLPRPLDGRRADAPPGLARLDDDVLARLRSDAVLLDGTFWQDDELAAWDLRAHRVQMGHVPLSAPAGR